MTTENELINKSYYQTIISENIQEHPIKILGDMYMDEMRKQRPELSSIRYAQGEVYFLNNDYEAAIHKWQYPLEKEELIPWAQKNIADAHLEMGLLDHAERFYKEVDTPSVALKSEVLLQLFSLYIQQGTLEKAVDTIKKAVKLNPDYSHVTEIAKGYFEEFKDWENAVELAVDEAVRTKSISWFKVLEGYAAQGSIVNYAPNYFHEMLVVLLHLDKSHFESLTEVMWNSYKDGGYYIQWLDVMNQLLLNHNVEQSHRWEKLPRLFNETYFELISGRYLIRDISNLVQTHLANWLKLSSLSDTLISSTAVLAWDETFPAELDATLISEAELRFEGSNPNQNGTEEGLKLFDSIKIWAKGEGLLEELTEFLKSMPEEYNAEVVSPSKIRNLLKATLEFLLEQRVELENAILEEINWNGEMLTGLQDMHQQLEDMEKEKVSVMIDSFRNIKKVLTENVMSKLPKLLRNCSELVQEDSDFSKLHVELNEEMNKRITTYMRNYILYDFKYTIQEWIENCQREFQDCQSTWNEFSEHINSQFKEDKIVLNGDYKVLEDWQRDMERISRGILQRENVNIMLRNNPSQLLLKGAGKLFGSITKNKDMLYSRYKNYIENADYTQIIGEIINPFIQQLEFFEGSIEWDINRFCSSSSEALKCLMEEVRVDIEKYNDSINMMHNQPENYRDPLTLFELKLRQYELMNRIS
ncbi:lipopolysaccharide assembly protein LapB [Paucisalibacillus sp. EB02]|uniref:tetratricopeptide repeat protein n=1 Tax=Paucisalibacillus sp. EB02 TaxID=1347087 RepID=UPI0004B69039|nr:hypothetical protein [Paucisalibacillus sp. EB02]